MCDLHTTLLSDTLKGNGHTGTHTSPGVWFRNKPTDLSGCVSEDRGHGEGEVVYGTLLSDTRYSNGHGETDTIPPCLGLVP